MLIRLLFGALVLIIASAAIYGGKADSSKAGLKPDSSFYFLDSLMERIDLWGTKDKEEKIKKLTELIEEKLNEAGDLLETGDMAIAQKALDNGDKYTKDALDFINSLKGEGIEADELAQSLGETVLKKQEILAKTYGSAPPAAKSFIESKIESNKDEVSQIINNLNAQSNEKLTNKIEQTAELAQDKIEEAREIEEQKDLEDLSAQEKRYNIWIDHFYATENNGQTEISAHIRRRDPKCGKFEGIFKVYINNTFYRSFKISANGYDDLRQTFDKFHLEQGNYIITGVLENASGNKISNKQIKIII